LKNSREKALEKMMLLFNLDVCLPETNPFKFPFSKSFDFEFQMARCTEITKSASKNEKWQTIEGMYKSARSLNENTELSVGNKMGAFEAQYQWSNILKLKKDIKSSIDEEFKYLVREKSGKFNSKCALDLTMQSHEAYVRHYHAFELRDACLKELKQTSLSSEIIDYYCTNEARRKFFLTFFENLPKNSTSLTPLITRANFPHLPVCTTPEMFTQCAFDNENQRHLEILKQQQVTESYVTCWLSNGQTNTLAENLPRRRKYCEKMAENAKKTWTFKKETFIAPN
jgi:hypothetical protein